MKPSGGLLSRAINTLPQDVGIIQGGTQFGPPHVVSHGRYDGENHRANTRADGANNNAFKNK